MVSGGGGDANGKHDGRDKLLFILRQSFVLACYIATALANQPKYIPLTFTALQRYDTLCHYTHNEHIFINQHTKAADLHKEINKIGIIDTLQRWGDLPLIPIYCTTKPSSSLKCNNMNDA